MSCGRQLVQTHVEVPCVLTGSRGRASSEAPHLKQDDRERPRRTDAEAEAGTVAQLLAHYLRLAIDHLDGAFGARAHANSAAGAKSFIYPNDLSCDGRRHLLLLLSSARRLFSRTLRQGFLVAPPAFRSVHSLQLACAAWFR
jgi:hypothetical protein